MSSFIIEFSDEAKKDILFFQKTGNKAILQKIKNLIIAIQENPFTGIGKPEPLKYSFSGLWSRRINREHRMIYDIAENLITILSLKGHYE
jgi:toxin YoeB